MSNGTVELLDLVHVAQDQGRETYMWWFNDELVERVEIDGVEFLNDVLDVESDGWRGVAEKFWQQ